MALCLSKLSRDRLQGKVERFIGDLKGSFWVPFVASMRQAGLKPDKQVANAAVGRWRREVANARVHATTGEVPAGSRSRRLGCRLCRRPMAGGRRAAERHGQRPRRS